MWIGGITAAALLGYGVAQMGQGNRSGSSNVTSFGSLPGAGYYAEAALPEVDFSVLTEEQQVIWDAWVARLAGPCFGV